MSDDLEQDPVQQRHANRTGLIIGGIALLIMLSFMAHFTINGLPKDPNILKRQRAANLPIPSPTTPVQETP